MEKNIKSAEEISKVVADIHEEIQPALYESTPNPTDINVETEKELNSNILKITMRIKDQFPELSKYLEEMPVTIPDEKHPKINSENLQAYYDSLNSMLNKYILEHPNYVK